MRTALTQALLRLVGWHPRPDAILLEASGIADPLGLPDVFRLPVLDACTRLDAVVTVVDAERAWEWEVDPRQASPGAEVSPRVFFGFLYQELFRRQVQTADIVVVNKVDLVSRLVRGQVLHAIRSLAPDARILTTTHGRVPLPLILDPVRHSRARRHDVGITGRREPVHGAGHHFPRIPRHSAAVAASSFAESPFTTSRSWCYP
jgi:G3E family GTPase